MGLSWRSSSGRGVGHGGVADVVVNVDVNAAMPPLMMQIVMGKEREINRSGLGWGLVF